MPWSLDSTCPAGRADRLGRCVKLPERGVAVVGAVPAGLPGLRRVPIPVGEIPDVLFAGAALGFVGLAEGLSAARLFAVEGSRVDAVELMAAGVSCVGSGLIGGLAVAGSLSKTAASDRTGGKTQAVGLTAAVLSLAVILFLAPALAGLPKAVLSARFGGRGVGLDRHRRHAPLPRRSP